MEDFHENILGGVILVYNRYSEQSVCNLNKRRTLPPLFSGEISKMNGTVEAEDLQENMLGGIILA